MLNLEERKCVPRRILAEVIPAKMGSMLLNKGQVNLYMPQYTEALLVRAKKSMQTITFQYRMLNSVYGLHASMTVTQ